jgi:hypothetical protein
MLVIFVSKKKPKRKPGRNGLQGRAVCYCAGGGRTTARPPPPGRNTRCDDFTPHEQGRRMCSWDITRTERKNQPPHLPSQLGGLLAEAQGVETVVAVSRGDRGGGNEGKHVALCVTGRTRVDASEHRSAKCFINVGRDPVSGCRNTAKDPQPSPHPPSPPHDWHTYPLARKNQNLAAFFFSSSFPDPPSLDREPTNVRRESVALIGGATVQLCAS